MVVATTLPSVRFRSCTRAAAIGVLSWFQAEPMTVVAWRDGAPPIPARASRRACGEAPANEDPARMNAVRAIPANFTSRFNLSADVGLIRYIKRTSFQKTSLTVIEEKSVQAAAPALC